MGHTFLYKKLEHVRGLSLIQMIMDGLRVVKLFQDCLVINIFIGANLTVSWVFFSFVSSVKLPPGIYELKMVCDGLSALSRVDIKHEYVMCSSKHVDIVSIISKLWEKSNFSFVK